jgi:hypothetical protein
MVSHPWGLAADITDTFFDLEPPIQFQSVAVEGSNYKYVDGPVPHSPPIANPGEWVATQQAIMVEDIYSGTSDWMNAPKPLDQAI